MLCFLILFRDEDNLCSTLKSRLKLQCTHDFDFDLVEKNIADKTDAYNENYV